MNATTCATTCAASWSATSRIHCALQPGHDGPHEDSRGIARWTHGAPVQRAEADA